MESLNMKDQINDYYAGNMTLTEFFEIGIKRKFTIIVVTFFFAIFSIFYALSVDDIYESRSILEVKQNNNIKSSNSMSAISSLAGISLGNSNEISEIIQTLKSRDFAKHLIKFDGVLESLLAVDFYDPQTKSIVFDNSLFDKKNMKWVRTPSANQKQTPTFLEAHYELQKNIISYKKIDDNYIEIIVEHRSPIFARDMLELIIEELNTIIRDKDTTVAKNAINFLNIELNKTNQVEIRKSINELIKPNLEMLMLADIDNYYKLEPVDQPFIPEVRSSPNRKLICIVITIFGFFLSYLYVLIQHIFGRNT